MARWLALSERTVVTSGATTNDTGVVHGRTGEQDGAAVALLTRQTRWHVVRGLAQGLGPVVTGGAARRDTGMIEGGACK